MDLAVTYASKSFIHFPTVREKERKLSSNLSKGDILKFIEREDYYQYDYLIRDDGGDFISFKNYSGIGSIIVKRKCLGNFFECKNNYFIVYEKTRL